MALLSDSAITILRTLDAAGGPVDRDPSWSPSAWQELVGDGLACGTRPPLPQARLSRRERRLEAERLLLRMRLTPEQVTITGRGRLRLARIDAGMRRAL